MSVVLRPYRSSADAASCYRLYDETLGKQWPLSEEAFADRAGQGIVAVVDGRVVGLAVFNAGLRGASLQLLLVAPAWQRHGIGARLHEAALQALREVGAGEVRLGAGTGYLWPGVPTNLPDAMAFFRRRGWDFTETCWDLVGNLRDYETPEAVMRRGGGIGVEYRLGRPGEHEAIVNFEERYFPDWLHFFQGTEATRAVLVVDRNGEIVGSLLVESPRDRRALWAGILGDDAGAIGAVGVAPQVREHGVGTALVARACEILRDEGTGNCHVGWTSLLSFYGRLGFEPWREYAMSRRDIASR